MLQQVKRSKGSVRYAFKDSIKVLEQDKKRESLIYLYFSYGIKRVKYSVGYKASLAQWDLKKQRIKNIRSYIGKDKVNKDLAYYEQSILEKYDDLYHKFGDNVDNNMIKSSLDIIVRKKGLPIEKDETTLSFLDLCNKYISDKGSSIAPTTVRKYKQAINLLGKYENSFKTTLTFDMIDLAFFSSFNSFLEKKNFGIGTIGKHVKSIKTFMNYATSQGYTKSLKYKTSSFTIGKQQSTAIYLSETELNQMREEDLSKTPNLERARDIFLIGAYTGQRVSDFNRLTNDDIVSIDGIQYFKFVQTKNRKQGKEVLCPVTKDIKEIMDLRYGGKTPPRMLDKDINTNIKLVGEKMGFNELIKHEYTKGGKVITEMIPKYKLIKSHTARRSFCTNMYLKKMPVFDIMLFSGHTSEREFYKYIRIKDEKRTQHIVSMGYFNL